MHELNWSHTDKESWHFHAGGSLRHRQAQTAAALFHGRDMEGRGVSNCLNVLVRVQVVICPWNGGKRSVVQIRSRLLEGNGIHVGIIRTALITSPPTSVDRQLH